MPDNQEFLPIKVVVTTDRDLTRPRRRRGKQKSFAENYERVREGLLRDLHVVRERFEAAFANSKLPCVAHVQLGKNAIAKSHRPDLLLQRTCPIIGAEVMRRSVFPMEIREQAKFSHPIP